MNQNERVQYCKCNTFPVSFLQLPPSSSFSDPISISHKSIPWLLLHDHPWYIRSYLQGLRSWFCVAAGQQEVGPKCYQISSITCKTVAWYVHISIYLTRSHRFSSASHWASWTAQTLWAYGPWRDNSIIAAALGSWGWEWFYIL